MATFIGEMTMTEMSMPIIRRSGAKIWSLVSKMPMLVLSNPFSSLAFCWEENSFRHIYKSRYPYKVYSCIHHRIFRTLTLLLPIRNWKNCQILQKRKEWHFLSSFFFFVYLIPLFFKAKNILWQLKHWKSEKVWKSLSTFVGKKFENELLFPFFLCFLAKVHYYFCCLILLKLWNQERFREWPLFPHG